MFELDVSSAVGLRRALEAVDRAPGGWESGVGAVVARAVVVELVRRVGRERVLALACRLSGVDEVRGRLCSEALDAVMLHRAEVVATAGDEEVWGCLVRRALWALDRAGVEESLHGLCGDSNPHRLLAKATAAGVVVGSLHAVGDGALSRARAVEVPGGLGRCELEVGVGDLGPVLSGVAGELVAVGVDDGLALSGTARVAQIAASSRSRERHTRAREDARVGGLAGLGVAPGAASAWMSLVAGSKKLGPESSLTLALRSGQGLSRHHRVWLEQVSAGVENSGAGGQLALFPRGWCEPAAA